MPDIVFRTVSIADIRYKSGFFRDTINIRVKSCGDTEKTDFCYAEALVLSSRYAVTGEKSGPPLQLVLPSLLLPLEGTIADTYGIAWKDGLIDNKTFLSGYPRDRLCDRQKSSVNVYKSDGIINFTAFSVMPHTEKIQRLGAASEIVICQNRETAAVCEFTFF